MTYKICYLLTRSITDVSCRRTSLFSLVSTSRLSIALHWSSRHSLRSSRCCFVRNHMYIPTPENASAGSHPALNMSRRNCSILFDRL